MRNNVSDNTKIYRLLSADTARKVLSPGSPFSLGSHRNYSSMECGREDDEESKRFTNIHLSTPQNTLISCWSILSGNNSIAWDRYKDSKDGVAVISTVGRVRSFLSNICDYIGTGATLDDREVRYCNNNNICRGIPSIFIKYDTPRFIQEEEYRFAIQPANQCGIDLEFGRITVNIENPSVYIDEIIISPHSIHKHEFNARYSKLADDVYSRDNSVTFFKLVADSKTISSGLNGPE